MSAYTDTIRSVLIAARRSYRLANPLEWDEQAGRLRLPRVEAPDWPVDPAAVAAVALTVRKALDAAVRLDPSVTSSTAFTEAVQALEKLHFAEPDEAIAILDDLSDLLFSFVGEIDISFPIEAAEREEAHWAEVLRHEGTTITEGSYERWHGPDGHSR